MKQFPKVFYLLTPFLSILLALVTIELLLAIFYPIPFSGEGHIFFIPDPYTGYRLKPNNICLSYNNIPTIVNSKGHRDHEVTFEKGDNIFRVLVLGDSFTVGHNVPQENTYPQILEDFLNKHSNKKYEVVNTGVGGWEPFQYAQYYFYYGKQFNPDLILIGFFVGNDTYNQHTEVSQTMTAVNGRLLQREKAESKFIKLKVFFYEKLHLARLILNKRIVTTSNNEKRFTRKDCEDFSNFYIYLQGIRVKNHLKRKKHLYNHAKNSIYQISRIKRDADYNSIPVVVVLIPDELQINTALQKVVIEDDMRNRYDFKMPQSMLVQLFQDINVGVIDLLPAFIKDTRCLYLNDTHWTSEGHKLAASIIYKEIFDCLKNTNNDGIVNTYDKCINTLISNQKRYRGR